MSADHKIDLQAAFVLHQRPYRESSLLLEVFGIGSGRVGLIAKGARRPFSPFRTQLRSFHALLLSWRGKGELGVLVGAEPDGPALVIPPAAIISGLYLNELLVRLLHRHDPHRELFDQYRRTLTALAEADCPVEQSLRIFEKRLLEAVGYGLMLERTADSGRPVTPESCYRYVTDHGPIEVGEKENSAGLRVQGSTLLALAFEQPMNPAELKEAKQLMRTAINVQLEGRPLVSRTMYPRKNAPIRARAKSGSTNPEAVG